MTMRRFLPGFTLIELLVTVLIAAVLASLAFPSVVGLIDKYRLRGAADNLVGDLQFARMEAIRNNQPVFVDISTGAAWCYGMKLGSAPCDCTQTSAAPGYCALKLVRHSENSNVTLTSQSFPSDPSFDPQQGLSSQAGEVLLQSRLGRQARLSLNRLGMVSLCTPSGASSAGYPPC